MILFTFLNQNKNRQNCESLHDACVHVMSKERIVADTRILRKHIFISWKNQGIGLFTLIDIHTVLNRVVIRGETGTAIVVPKDTSSTLFGHWFPGH